MNASLRAAIKEAYATAPSTKTYTDTIQVSHPSLTSSLWFVKNSEDLSFRLETGTYQLFTAAAFAISLPKSGDGGVNQIRLAMDDVNQQVSDFFNSIKGSKDPVIVTYRPYLLSDPSTVQMNPPLQLELTDIDIDDFSVQGNCSFADLVNRPFPNEYYTRDRFPGLGSI